MAVYFSAFIPYFSWMVAPLFALLRKNVPWTWESEHEKAFQLVKLSLASAPVRGHPIAGGGYRLYTDASNTALAGALQQIQPISVADLKGTRLYERLEKLYHAKKKPPSLVTKLADHDVLPTNCWAENFDDTVVHVERVIAYWSRACKDAETRYSATEREALAAKESLVKFQPFIEGEKIQLVTDHAALQWAKTYENANQRLSAWGAVFSAYAGMEIIHRPGRVHSNVDPISRLARTPEQVSPVDDALPVLDISDMDHELATAWKEFTYQSAKGKAAFIATRSQTKSQRAVKPTAPVLGLAAAEDAVQVPSEGLPSEDEPVQVVPREGPRPMLHIKGDLLSEFTRDYPKDREFQKLWSSARSENAPESEGRYVRFAKGSNGLLYFKDADWPASPARLCVPAKQQSWIIQEAHDHAQEAAHGGPERTLSRLKENFYWRTMRRDVLAYCGTCDVCQKTKTDRSKAKGFLSPLRVPRQPYEVITMDFITGLPESNGKTAILVVVDKLTKFATFIPTTSDVTAEGTARLLFQRVFKLFGLPTEIVSDRDPRFTSNFWKALASHYDTRLAMSTARHPQTDGQTEVTNQTLETMLRAYVANDRHAWSSWLDVLEQSYNAAKHSSTGLSPAKALMGFTPRTPLSRYAQEGAPIPQTISKLADERISELESYRQAARDAIIRASDRQAFYYDKRRKAVLFKEGDEVLINPHTLELVDVAGAGRKLMHRRIGPFTISEVISPTAYRLNLPDTLPMHNVVNIQHLSRYCRATENGRPVLANPRDGLIASEEYEVEDILEARFNKKKRRKEFLVRWLGYGPEHDSWQTTTDLRNAPEVLKKFSKLQL
jgi:transposase InsO family protein